MRFIRQAKVIIKLRDQNYNYLPNPIVVTGLRISFSIKKTIAYTTNTAIIKIWNLSQDNRNLLKNFGDQVTIYAGYRDEENLQILFIGDTFSVSHIYDQPEIVTVLECGDGDRYLNQVRVNLSFGANVPAVLVFKEIASQVGIQFDQTQVPPNLIYRWGYKDCVMSREAIATVAGKLNLKASIQNYRLVVSPINPVNTTPPIFVSEDTGMQGIPQRFTYRNLDLFRPHPVELQAPLAPKSGVASPTTGYKVNMILSPQIVPDINGAVLLTSQHLNIERLNCYAKSIQHEGDTFGFVWSTQLELIELPSNVS